MELNYSFSVIELDTDLPNCQMLHSNLAVAWSVARAFRCGLRCGVHCCGLRCCRLLLWPVACVAVACAAVACAVACAPTVVGLHCGLLALWACLR